MDQVLKADNSANYVGSIENATIIAMDLSQNFGATFEFTGETGLSLTKKNRSFHFGVKQIEFRSDTVSLEAVSQQITKLRRC